MIRLRLLIRLCYAATLTIACPTAWAVPAFPGAEGPGSDASGGRGGDVYHVTNLLDDHDGTIPGSLRYGLATAPSQGRTIVFDVGGTINLVPDPHNSTHTWLRSGAGNITLAGHTAPGAAGITITGQGAKLSGNNWILRHVKFRPGQDQSRPGVLTNDGITNNLQNSIIDHVSVSWADDEGLSSTDFVTNTTVQYSIIGEGLNYNNHSYGSLISSEVDDAQIGYHHNLYLHNRSRNPRLGSEKGTGAITSFTNNVVYNWHGWAGYSFEKPSRTNYLGNYYIAGADTGAGDPVFFSPDQQTIIYHNDTNRVDMNKNGAVDGIPFSFSGQQFSGTYQQASTAFDVPSGYVQTATEAVDQVMDYVGAAWWDRDPIDQRLTDDVRNGTGVTINHIIDAPQNPAYTYDAEGYPQYGVSTRSSGFDTDNDGMPNYWELRHGLNPNSADNNADIDNDNYTNLEDYLNELGAFPAPRAIQWIGGSTRYAETQNWGLPQTVPTTTFSNWQPSRYDRALILSGSVDVDSPGQHAGRVELGNSRTPPSLTVSDGWLKVHNIGIGESDGTIVIGDTSPASLSVTGGLLRAATLSKGALGSFQFSGGVLAVDSIQFDFTNQGGALAPGDPLGEVTAPVTALDLIGTTNVLGDATLSAGSLEIDLLSLTQNDVLQVSGQLTLGGDLNISLLDGFTPTSGSWIIASAGSLTGDFASITPGYSVSQQGSNLVLSLGADLPGDFNSDGKVDAQDYAFWREGYATGQYTTSDFDAWRSHYGATATMAPPTAPPASPSQTPSPAGGALLLTLILCQACSRHDR